MKTQTIEWLRAEGEAWVRLGVLRELDGRGEDDRELAAAQREFLAHPLTKKLMAQCRGWPGYALKSHKDAKHPIHGLALLGDLGLRSRDRGAITLASAVLKRRQRQTGAFTIDLLLPKAFGGSGAAEPAWMLCDAPLVLHGLLALGLGHDPRVAKAAEHLAGLAKTRDVADGWPCASSFPGVRGPGRKRDPCPYATLVALRALAHLPALRDSEVCQSGVEMLLTHWQQRKERKLRMFGIGTDFAKLKYPLVWYDLLHVVDVLSRFEWARDDRRFKQMTRLLFAKADRNGRYTPESVWMAFKPYDFAQKREPSPTLTWAVTRITHRLQG